jgi:cell division transport system ATP-binding protein
VATHEKSIVDEMKKRVVAISKGLIVRDQEKGLYRDEDKNSPAYN